MIRLFVVIALICYFINKVITSVIKEREGKVGTLFRRVTEDTVEGRVMPLFRNVLLNIKYHLLKKCILDLNLCVRQQ